MEIVEPGRTHIDRGHLSLVSCASGRAFAERVDRRLADIFEREHGLGRSVLRDTDEVHFANGEVKTVVHENIRGDDVYVIQCLDDPLLRPGPGRDEPRSINDNLVALLTALNAAYQSDADAITAVVPQFPYSRQERKKTREPITARLMANAIEDAGARRVITLDIHAEAIEGFFHRAILEDLHASREIAPAFLRRRARLGDDTPLVVVAPDTGSTEKARHYSNRFRCSFAIVDKCRDYSQPSVIEEMRLVGDVEGCEVFVPDDMIGTGGTLVNACRLLRDEGAARIHVACSLPFFNGPAVERLDEAYAEGLFESVIGTDAVWHGPDFAQAHPWYHEISVAGLFAEVIFHINHKRSVSQLMS